MSLILRLAGIIITLVALCVPSDAQEARPKQDTRSFVPNERALIERINKWTVGLAGGLLEGAPIRLATEIARVVNDDNLHVLPIVTRGPTENVNDLLYLKGVDLAIINTDSLEEYKTQVPQIQQRIETEGGVEYAHIVLQGDAWAKTRRPTTAIFPPSRTPIIGSGDFGEMIVELTAESVPAVQRAISRAEVDVIFKEDKKTGGLVAKPSRARGEVGAIQIVRPHEPADRRRFSAEEAMNWLSNPQTGGVYIIETFADPHEVAKDNRRSRAKAALERFYARVQELPVDWVDAPQRYLGSRLLFLKLTDSGANPSRDARLAQHQAVLDFLDREPAVRRVMLPPIIEIGHTLTSAVNHS